MTKNSNIDPETIQKRLINLVSNFEKELKSENLRNKVLSLVPVFHALRALGKSLIPRQLAASARDRILVYFQKYPHTVIRGDEFLVVSGIQEYARRIRELRVQFGWAIVSGKTAKEMAAEGEFPLETAEASKMKPDDYVLIAEQQDKEAAYRWLLPIRYVKRKWE